MSDLSDRLSDTHGITMAQAVESVVELALSTAIANESVDPITSETAIAIASNPTIIAPVIPTGGNAYAPGSTNPYLVYLSQLGVGSRRTKGISDLAPFSIRVAKVAEI